MNYLNRLLPFVAICVFLYGCGDASKSSTVPFSSAQKSAECISCHGSNTSTVTGAKVTDEWRASAHNTKDGAACGSCHEKGRYPHPDGVVSYSKYSTITVKPDDTICTTCHTTATMRTYNSHFKQYSTYFAYVVDSTTGRVEHKNYASRQSSTDAADLVANFVSDENPQRCRVCHNPHDNTSKLTYNKDWSASLHGHGSPTAYPFAANESGQSCNRCHTTRGFIFYIMSGKTMATSKFVNSNTAELIACNACHTDYSWARRTVGPVTADYNRATSSSNTGNVAALKITYPDSADSNFCINCHVGREIGDTVKYLIGSTNFANKAFENSHYLPGGATVFAISGFTNFSGTTAHTYPDSNGNTHAKLGIIISGNKGPCVTCHLSSPNSHTFKPVEETSDGSIMPTTTLCANCHSFGTASLKNIKAGFNAAMDALKAQLALRGFYFHERNPYFFTTSNAATVAAATSTTSISVTNWASATGDISTNKRATGQKNMGAAFNYNVLNHDPGAFAHYSRYAKILIYDSIDWLDNNKMDFSTGTTLSALAAGTAYKDAAIAYLLKNGAATGTSSERP